MAKSSSSKSSKAAAPKAAAPKVNTNPKTNGGIYQSTVPAKPATSAGAGTNIGFNTKTIIPVTKKSTVDYSKMQSKLPTPVNQYTQGTLNTIKGNNIIPTISGQMQSYAPKKTNPVSSNKGVASGPNQNMSVAPTPKAKANPTSLKNSSNMFEALPGYSDPFGSVFKAPDFSNAMAKTNSAKGEQYQSTLGGKSVDPKTQRAMEAKLVSSGKNSAANAAALKEQLDGLGYDSSFLKTDYSNYNKNLLDANRMNQTNKLKGQNSDPETAKLLASFGNQSKTTQQKLAELSALLARKGDKDAQKNAQILLSNLDASNQNVKDSYNIDANKALAGAGAMADMPTSTIPTTAAKPVSTEPMMSVAPTVETPATPVIPNIGGFTPDYSGFKAPEKTTPTEPMQSVVPAPTAQKDTTTDTSGTGTSATMPGTPELIDVGDITTPEAAAPTTTPVTAPNGKNYQLTKGADGKVGFVNVNGEMQYFQNYDAAVGYINSKNPVGSKGGEANVLKAVQPGETPMIEADINSEDNNNLLTKQVDEYNAKKQYSLDNIAQANNSVLGEIEKARSAGDNNWADNMSILGQSITGITNLFSNIDGLVSGLTEKATELFDRGSMRSANARAQQMADKGYLTSDQVAQVANYSVADYKRDVDIKRVDVEKQIAEKKIDLAQAKEKLINDVRTNQMTTNDAKLAQINYIEKTYQDVISTFQDKEDQVKQFYDNQTAATQALAAQANVSANSIIQNDDATNQAQQNNKARAGSDDTARVNYILSRIPDQNLHKYAMQAIDTLIKNNKFMTPNVESLAAQIATAANALQQRDLKALK